MPDHRTEPDIWAAMWRIRRCHHHLRPVENRGLLAMLSTWAKVGSRQMHEWSIETADFAADLLFELHDDLSEGGWDVEREILPTILSLLTWEDEGPVRKGEPEDFMADMIATLKQGSAALALNCQSAIAARLPTRFSTANPAGQRQSGAVKGKADGAGESGDVRACETLSGEPPCPSLYASRRAIASVSKAASFQRNTVSR